MKCSEYFLSIEHGSEINIFDIRRGKIDRLNGGIRGVPRRSPFVRTDCTLKQKDSLYVVGALKGAADMSLYKSDPNTGKWIGLGPIPENTIKVGIDKCSQFNSYASAGTICSRAIGCQIKPPSGQKLTNLCLIY